jgi:peptide/nickel transport system permease protein
LCYGAVALLGPELAPYAPNETHPEATLHEPSPQYRFGTDKFGRDIYSRVLYATRLDLSIAFSVAVSAFLLGAAVGAISGYYGGGVDDVIMRGVDVLMAFPAFILAMALTGILGDTIPNVIMAITAAYIPYFIRLTRGEMLRVRTMQYADAAVTVGNPRWRVVLVHLLPNSLTPAFIQVTLVLGWAILDAAGLAFLGLGITPPTAEWGVMVAEGAQRIIHRRMVDLAVPRPGDRDHRLRLQRRRGWLARPAGPRGTVMAEPLLQVRSLRLDIKDHEKPRSVLLDVGFDVRPNEVMGLVGESGSGKTMTALAIMRLLPPAARIVGGQIDFGGQDLLALTEAEMRNVRGSGSAMIFQNPRGALNPLMRAGDQVGRALQIHQGVSGDEAGTKAVELLRHVGISDAEARARAYPHQLSGGMAQVLIAVMRPANLPLIADERRRAWMTIRPRCRPDQEVS